MRTAYDDDDDNVDDSENKLNKFANKYAILIFIAEFAYIVERACAHTLRYIVLPQNKKSLVNKLKNSNNNNEINILYEDLSLFACIIMGVCVRTAVKWAQMHTTDLVLNTPYLCALQLHTAQKKRKIFRVEKNRIFQLDYQNPIRGRLIIIDFTFKSRTRHV